MDDDGKVVDITPALLARRSNDGAFWARYRAGIGVPIKPCMVCNGTGKIAPVYTDCLVCDGRGVIAIS